MTFPKLVSISCFLVAVSSTTDPSRFVCPSSAISFPSLRFFLLRFLDFFLLFFLLDFYSILNQRVLKELVQLDCKTISLELELFSFLATLSFLLTFFWFTNLQGLLSFQKCCFPLILFFLLLPKVTILDSEFLFSHSFASFSPSSFLYIFLAMITSTVRAEWNEDQMKKKTGMRESGE